MFQGGAAFGTNKGLFGGGSSTTGFPGVSLGGGTNAGGGLFGGKPTTSAFGSTTPGQTGSFGSGGFGTGMGGGTGGGLFANTSTSSTGFGGLGQTGSGGLFGTANKSTFQTPQTGGIGTGSFGGTGFGTGTAGVGLFQTPTSSAASGLFGANKSNQTTPFASGTTPGLFGGAFAGGLQQNVSGTPIKFDAIKDRDTVQKNGQTVTINTRLQVISGMKEYNLKSLEELRWEDYNANRRGGGGGGMFSQTGAGLGVGVFGQQQQQQQAGGIFGQTSSANTGGLFGTGTQSAGGMFGGKTSGLGFGQQQQGLGVTGGLFGQQQQQQQQTGGLFGGGGQAAGGVFGQQGQTGTSVFGQNQAQAGGSLFGGKLGGSTGFGTGLSLGAQAQTGGMFGAQTGGQSGLFGNKIGGGVSLGGGTSTAGGLTLGGSTGGLLGQSGGLGLQGNQLKIGTSTAGGLGLGGGTLGSTTLGGGGGLGLGGGLIGGTSTNLGGLGGTSLGGSTGLSLGGGMTSLGGGGLGGLGGTNSFAQPVTLGTSAQLAAQQQVQLVQQMTALQNSPFGDSPLFKTALQDVKSISKEAPPTAVTKASSTPLHMKVSTMPATRVRPQPLGSRTPKKNLLFDGLESDAQKSPDLFVPRSSVKKLVIKPKRQSLTENLGDDNTGEVTTFTEPAKDTKVQQTSATLTSTPVKSSALHSLVTPLGKERSVQTPDHTSSTPLVTSANRSNGIPTPLRTPLSAASKSREPESPELLLNSVYSNPVSRPAVRQYSPGSDDSMAILGQQNHASLGNSASFQDESDAVPDSTVGGVILQRKDYFTHPPLDQLRELLTEDGKLEVENFEIGRRGYGQVHFPGVTDIAGLNLDEIVYICQSEVTIYPDDSSKPAVGTGLNRRAVITLHGVWPKDKTTGEPIKSPERLASVNYRNKVQRSTGKIGARFIDYEAETGSWIFEVEHFSKYRLPEEEESDDDDGTAAVVKKKVKIIPRASAVIPAVPQSQLPSGLLSQVPPFDKAKEGFDADSAMVDEDEIALTDDQPVPSMDVGTASSHQLATTLGVEPQRVQVMKASFFADEDDMELTLGANVSQAGRQLAGLSHDQSFSSQRGRLPLASGALSASMTFQHLPPSAREMTLDAQLPSLGHSSPARFTHLMSAGQQSSTPPLPQPVGLPQRSLLQSSSNVGRIVTGRRDVIGSPMPPHLASLPVLPSGRDMPSDIPDDDELLHMSVMKAQRSVEPTPVEERDASGQDHQMADAGLVMGRSFRVGWGPGWRLAHCGSPLGRGKQASGSNMQRLLLAGLAMSSSDQSTPHSVTVEQLLPATYLHDGNTAAQGDLIRTLKIQLDNSRFLEEDDVPLAEPGVGSDSLHEHCLAAEEATSGMTAVVDDEDVNRHYTALAWSLAVALWGKLSNAVDTALDGVVDSYPTCIARRQAVTNWLARASSDDIARDVQFSESNPKDSAAYLKALFGLLTGLQITAARQLAHSHGDTHLARLLSQGCSSASTREYLILQLQEWARLKTDQFMDPDRLKVYSLLAGAMVWHGSTPKVKACTCDGLDWRRAFAVHLWYGSPANASVMDGLREYIRAFKGDNDNDSNMFGCYATPPHPPHSSAAPTHEELVMDAEDGDSSRSPAVRDLCFHLLRLYCKRTHRLQRSLDPATHTRHILDYRLSWTLHCALRSLNFTHMPGPLQALLHTSFLAQLLAMGHWIWAIFVALHLENAPMREKTVRDILARWCSLSDSAVLSEDELFLVNELQVPEVWIHDAKAIRARYDGLRWLEAEHLLLAGHWEASHDLIVNHLASRAIVDGETDSLQHLLEQLEPFDRSVTISSWSTAGQVYLLYLRVTERLHTLSRGASSVYRLEELEADVGALSELLRELPVTSALDRLCQAEMAKKCINYVKLIATLQQHPASEDMLSDSVSVPASRLVPYLTMLPLPEDYCLLELGSVTQQFVTSLA